jgi:hypothetical protein
MPFGGPARGKRFVSAHLRFNAFFFRLFGAASGIGVDCAGQAILEIHMIFKCAARQYLALDISACRSKAVAGVIGSDNGF